MKNSIKICLSCLIVGLVALVFVIMYFTIFKTNDEIKELEVTTNSIVLEIGDTKDLKDCYNVTPASASILVMCYIGDASFAEINSDNIILAKSVGETTILLKCKVDNKVLEKEISLIVVEKSLIPSSFSFEHETVCMGLATTNCYNKIVCSDSYNVEPNIEYSNSGVCEYNYTTGLITPLSLGSTNVTVKFVKDNVVVSSSFTVVVEEIYRTIETNLTKEGDYYILLLNENKFASVTLKVYEAGVVNSNIQLKFEFVSNTINANVVQFEYSVAMIKAYDFGEAILKVYCVDDESIFINILIKAE